MPLFPCLRSRCVTVVALAAALAACGTAATQGEALTKVITPYKIDIVQGNVVTREQRNMLQPGMPRAIVQDVLGTPLLVSVFHADRWDYVFTFRRQGSAEQVRKMTVFFSNDVIDRIEADDLPSENEFVASLRSGVRLGPVPALTATEEALKKFPPPHKVTAPETSQPAISTPRTAVPEPGRL